jgi:hypothetical protein
MLMYVCNLDIQIIYMLLFCALIYNCKHFHFRRYLLHVVEYVLNIVEHDAYTYLFLNVKENEISVYLNCDQVDVCLAVKYYILKWMYIFCLRV